MLNLSASLAMSTSVLKAFPGKLDIKRHSPSILHLLLLLLLLDSFGFPKGGFLMKVLLYFQMVSFVSSF